MVLSTNGQVNTLSRCRCGFDPRQDYKMLRYANRNKRPDFQSGHRKMCAGSNPVRSTNGNDVTQVVTLVCKTRAFGRCEFESRHSHNKGERQRWRVGLVCKISGLRLSGFDSHLSHKWSYRLMVRITDFHSVDTGSIPVRTTKNKMIKIR